VYRLYDVRVVDIPFFCAFAALEPPGDKHGSHAAIQNKPLLFYFFHNFHLVMPLIAWLCHLLSRICRAFFVDRDASVHGTLIFFGHAGVKSG
jgi:hypothetical protein